MIHVAMRTLIVSFEWLLAVTWVISAVMLFRAIKRSKSTLLLPMRIFGIVISVLWVFIYFVAATAIFSQFRFGTPIALHAIGNGLLFVTVLYFMLTTYLSGKILDGSWIDQ